MVSFGGSLLCSPRSLDSQKTWLLSSKSSRASLSFLSHSLYFPYFLHTVNKAAAVHLYIFIGNVFKDLRISPPLISNEEVKLPLLCVCVSFVFVFVHSRLDVCMHLVRFSVLFVHRGQLMPKPQLWGRLGGRLVLILP